MESDCTVGYIFRRWLVSKVLFFPKRMYTFSQENRPKLPLAKRDARGEGLCDKYTQKIYSTGQLKHDT